MKKIICVHKKETADRIADALGCKYMTQNLGGHTVYSFVETDRLHKLLNGSGAYSKKDWFYDNKLRF